MLFYTVDAFLMNDNGKYWDKDYGILLLTKIQLVFCQLNALNVNLQ